MKLPHNKDDNIQHKKLKLVLKVVALGLGLFLIYLFLSQVDPQKIKTKLFEINWRFIYIIGITFTAYLMASVAWNQSFLLKPKNISIMDLFWMRLSGESLAQVNPTSVIAGDTLKAYLLKRKGVNYKAGVVSITISRFLIVLSGITLILLGIFIFFDLLNIISAFKKYVIITVIAALVVVIIWFLHSGKGILYIPIKVLSFVNNKLKASMVLVKVIANFHKVNDEINEFYKLKKGMLVSAYTLSFLHWVTGAMEYYVILQFLGFDISVLSCVAIEVGVNSFKLVGSFIPGQIGIEELGVNKMLSFAGITGAEIYVTVAILRRVRQLFWIGAGALIFFIIMKKTKEIDNGSVVYNT